MERIIDHLKEILGIVASIAFAVFTYKSDIGGNNEKLDLFYSTVIGLLSNIAIAQLFRSFEIKNIERSLKDLVEWERVLSSSNRTIEAIERNLWDLGKVNEIVGAVGHVGAREAVAGFKVDPDKGKLYVKGGYLTMFCYSHFWEELVAHLSKRRLVKTVIARMTHSVDIQGWKAEYDGRMSQHHAAFHSFGGKAFRVLIDTRPRGSDISEYLIFMKQMEIDHVLPVYVNWDCLKDLQSSYWLSDFCIVDYPKYVARWEKSGQKVNGFSLTSEAKNQGKNPRSSLNRKYNTHMNEWRNILARVESANYKLDSNDPVNEQILNRYRKIFFAESPL